MNENRISLLDLTEEELKQELISMGEKPFRAKQIMLWLSMCVPFDEMSNLPKALREKLKERYTEGYPEVETELVSRDGTRKYLLKLSDGSLIETVLMDYSYGKTICISTQVGCPMGCAFCASGIGGLKRQLSSGEMLGEVLKVNSLMGEGRNIRNIVLMGTGEPLLNYENVVKFLRCIHSENSLGIAYRNISLSTCGIEPAIRRFTEEGIPLTLCLSLHSAIPEKRRKIMPVEERWSLTDSVKAMSAYMEKTGRRFILEYILLKDFNMGKEDADALKELLNGETAHINLIPMNGDTGPYSAPSEEEISRFEKMLEIRGLSFTRRRSLGQDIEGACGQLRAKYIKED